MTGISIVITTYNSRELLREFLPSVLAASARYRGESEIIIVDNCSSDGTQEFLKQHFPGIRVLALGKNCGYGFASNWGISHCKHNIVLLLNSDVWLKEDFFEYIPGHFDSKETFGVRVRTFPFKGKLKLEEDEAGFPLRWKRGEFKYGFIYVPALESCPPSESVHGMHSFDLGGGVFAVDKNKWLTLGGFDGLFYPFYGEETDIAYRALKHGWRIMQEPRSIAFHRKDSPTISKSSKGWLIKLVGERNRYFLVWKNISDPLYLIQHLFYVPLRLFKDVISTDFVSFLAFFYALLYIPKICSARKKEKKEARIPDREVFQYFSMEHCRKYA